MPDANRTAGGGGGRLLAVRQPAEHGYAATRTSPQRADRVDEKDVTLADIEQIQVLYPPVTM